MPFHYKVPAKREYQNKPMKCGYCGNEATEYRLFLEGGEHIAQCSECEEKYKNLKVTFEGEEVKRVEKEEIEPEKEVIAIRPDIPKGVSYVGKMIDDDTYVIKTGKPIRSLKNQETRQADEKERRETKDTARIAEIKVIDSLKNSFSRGVRR